LVRLLESFGLIRPESSGHLMRLPLLRHPNRESGTAPDSTCSWGTSNMNQTDSRGTRKNVPFRMFKIEHPRRWERFRGRALWDRAYWQCFLPGLSVPLRWGRFLLKSALRSVLIRVQPVDQSPARFYGDVAALLEGHQCPSVPSICEIRPPNVSGTPATWVTAKRKCGCENWPPNMSPKQAILKATHKQRTP